MDIIVKAGDEEACGRVAAGKANARFVDSDKGNSEGKSFSDRARSASGSGARAGASPSLMNSDSGGFASFPACGPAYVDAAVDGSHSRRYDGSCTAGRGGKGPWRSDRRSSDEEAEEASASMRCGEAGMRSATSDSMTEEDCGLAAPPLPGVRPMEGGGHGGGGEGLRGG